jgi:acyl-CoA dehydrogenase
MFEPPISSLMLALRTAGALDQHKTVSADDAYAILAEAGRFAAQTLAPLNTVGDRNGAKCLNGVVTTPPGWREAYQAWIDAGWSSLCGHEAFGGQQLPMILAVATTELWNAANMAFALNPLLTTGAIEAITAHASDEIKQAYLPNLISGFWTGTMNLTEPQSGSDLSGLRCKAVKAADGSYRISGQKIYITYGEHDCAENIIHLVLARLEGAPAGTRGISLFLVPKLLPDGSRNDLRCHSIEHKLGIHGSPTCTMIYGDLGGATGWLIGEENRGLACMFTMMNNARLLVGVQGVGIAEHATQKALAYAKERKQGRAPGRSEGLSPIVEHPDVARMLIEMRARTMAARLICMATAAAIDQQSTAPTAEARAQTQARAALLTPLAKSCSTDMAVEVASLGVQVHGGMGFVEETGAAQLLRDARILPIYEGTNGIQAADLVLRKIKADNGIELDRLLADCGQMAADASADPACETASFAAQRALSRFKASLSKVRDAEPAHALAWSTFTLQALSSIVGGAYLLRCVGFTENQKDRDEALANAGFFIQTCLLTDVARLEAVADFPLPSMLHI